MKGDAEDREWALAAETLDRGGVAVLPTDTVYGLAARPDFPGAVERLYAVKGRNPAKPIAFLASDVDAVERMAGPLPAEVRALVSRHWPGALTVVMGGEGFRVPDHERLRRLIARCGGLLRVTSANPSGRAPATSAEEAREELGGLVDCIVDGGPSPGGVASTVVRVLPGGGLETLRPGPVSADVPACLNSLRKNCTIGAVQGG